MRQQPKKNFNKLGRQNNVNGNLVRKSYQNVILDNAPVFPKPLEYVDIDNAMFEFVDKSLDLVVDGKLVPTFTLYSNQRFSEYTQMWEHSDEFGNLYLNFKTINRSKDPSFGGNQGDLWNIPGQRKYVLSQRTVLDDNGTESYEIYTMKQPYAVDLSYSLTFITTTFERLNDFNQKLNKLFSARQYYIRPNGYYIPIILDELNDETSYSINERKFFVQTANLKVMAYIIEEKDFEVKKYPKRTNLMLEGDKFMKNKACVTIEEGENYNNKELRVNISFKPYHTRAEFTFDTNMTVKEIQSQNVRNVRLMINDMLYYTNKDFKIKDGDEVMINALPIEETKECSVQLMGYEDDSYYKVGEIPEKVSDEKIKSEVINIEY